MATVPARRMRGPSIGVKNTTAGLASTTHARFPFLRKPWTTRLFRLQTVGLDVKFLRDTPMSSARNERPSIWPIFWITLLATVVGTIAPVIYGEIVARSGVWAEVAGHEYRPPPGIVVERTHERREDNTYFNTEYSELEVYARITITNRSSSVSNNVRINFPHDVDAAIITTPDASLEIENKSILEIGNLTPGSSAIIDIFDEYRLAFFSLGQPRFEIFSNEGEIRVRNNSMYYENYIYGNGTISNIVTFFGIRNLGWVIFLLLSFFALLSFSIGLQYEKLLDDEDYYLEKRIEREKLLKRNK